MQRKRQAGDRGVRLAQEWVPGGDEARPRACGKAEWTSQIGCGARGKSENSEVTGAF